ncbi:MAG: GGDEF domain-containing protein [Rhodocyclaceae bacterium]|nr:GGDEF domain-containing protein [Rhodocyclaceae bacterium]
MIAVSVDTAVATSMLEYLKDYTYRCEVPPEHFAHMVDWLLQWRKRDATMSFSLVLIDFKNPEALGNALGAKYARELLTRIAREIDAAVRTTDLLCRTRVSCFWVLLPKGEPDIVLAKLAPIIDKARQDGMDASQLHLDKLVVPRDVASDVGAAELFEHLLTGRS